MEKVVIGCFCMLFCVVGVLGQAGSCTSGVYGPGCATLCGLCKTPPCDSVTGVCKGGCKPGRIPDDKCQTKCPAGKYGQDCNEVCSDNCSTTPCTPETGACTCKPGYKPPTCKLPCASGTYGQDCKLACANCKDGAACDKITGACSACAPGYTPASKCKTRCSSGTYGQDCQERCGNCEGGKQCNHITGTCSRCQAGYKPSLCKTECDAGGWGPNCRSICSSNCQNRTSCDKTNGHCVCKPGYQPPLCTRRCEAGKYGQDCLNQCGHCHGGKTDCSFITGRCSRCVDNREMPLCKDCVPGHFGPTCGQRCGHCGGEGRCQAVSGECLSEVCLPGWTSSKCDQKCPEGWYGQNCTHKCGHCHNGSPCRHDNGACELECEEDYEGVLCKRSKESLVGPIVGSVLGAGFLIALAIVAAVLIMKRCRKKKSLPVSEDDTEVAKNDDDNAVSLVLPSSSDVYQNYQVNHGASESNHVNPSFSPYDRVDNLAREANAHLYDQQQNLGLPETQASEGDEQDHLYQNTDVVLGARAASYRRPTGEKMQKPVMDEPEATYGNV